MKLKLKELKGLPHTVSARIPANIFEDFQKSLKLANSKGFDVSLTEIIVEAIEVASKQIYLKFQDKIISNTDVKQVK